MIPITGASLPKSGILSFQYYRGVRPNGDDHVHNGIDLPAPKGTPVFAAEGGIVTHAIQRFAVGFSGYGKTVVIKSDSRKVWFLYAHLSEVFVSVGDHVGTGAKIGLVGSTAYTAENQSKVTGANHLHFETAPNPYPMSYAAERLNPITVLLTTTAGKVAVGGGLVLLSLIPLIWFLVKKRKH